MVKSLAGLLLCTPFIVYAATAYWDIDAGWAGRDIEVQVETSTDGVAYTNADCQPDGSLGQLTFPSQPTPYWVRARAIERAPTATTDCDVDNAAAISVYSNVTLAQTAWQNLTDVTPNAVPEWQFDTTPPAMISFVGSADTINLAGGHTSTSVTHGLTINADDVVLLFVTHGPQNSGQYRTVTPPAGFTSIIGAQAPQWQRMDVYRRIATAAEPASYTVTFGGGVDASMLGVLVYRNVDTADPVPTSVSAVNGNAGTVAIPAITTQYDNSWRIAIVGYDGNSDLANNTNRYTGWGASLTERLDRQNFWAAGGAADVLVATPGAQSAPTVNQSTNTGSIAFSLELRRAVTSVARTQTTSLQAAIQQQDIIRTATLTANLQRRLMRSTATDAVIQAQQLNTVANDAILLGSVTQSTTVDTLLQRAVTLQAALSALAQTGRISSADADALLQQAQSITASLNAIVQQTDTVQSNLNAALQTVSTLTSTLDAALSTSGALQTTLSSTVQGTQSTSSSLNAVLLSISSVVINAAFNAVLQQTAQQTTTLNASVQINDSITAALTASVQSSNDITTALDSVIQTVFSNTLSLSATLQRSQSQQTSLSAFVINPAASAVITALNALLQTQSTNTVTLDGHLQTRTTFNTALDAIRQTQNALSVQTDAILQSRRTAQTTVNANVQTTQSLQALFSAILIEVAGQQVNLGALLLGTGTTLVAFNAIIGTEQSTQNIIRTKLFSEPTLGILKSSPNRVIVS